MDNFDFKTGAAAFSLIFRGPRAVLHDLGDPDSVRSNYNWR